MKLILGLILLASNVVFAGTVDNAISELMKGSIEFSPAQRQIYVAELYAEEAAVAAQSGIRNPRCTLLYNPTNFSRAQDYSNLALSQLRDAATLNPTEEDLAKIEVLKNKYLLLKNLSKSNADKEKAFDCQ
jgi:hypothetical protein